VHAALMGVAGLVVAIVNGIRPGGVTLRALAWQLGSLSTWFALLRMPLYGVCTLLLAAGLGRPISAAVVAFSRHPRASRSALAGLLGVLIVLAALSSGRQAVRNSRAAAVAAAAPHPGARNVVLIVWDTVRASNLSLYGYPRPTTPNLMAWARKGVRYILALAPATWTYPSHSCFFTGRWPYQLNSQWNSALDAPAPTLAEYLASRGYQTAGFAANTQCCSYETGLDRGFAHYEDYPLTPRFLLGRTAPGSWLLKNVVSGRPFYDSKWIDLQSRDARGINTAFLDWLQRRRRDRPFFAFLNYFDAHEPYVPPPEYAGRFGIRPKAPQDYQFLLNYSHIPMRSPTRNILMARDCYDDCIAFLDDQLGRLLEALQGQGLLENTLVILTGDHGEAFGDHDILRHGSAIYLDQTAVPLVILSPDAPAGRAVTSPVSLRDLPATVVDQLGLAAGSPFPGHSLAACWSRVPGAAPAEITPAFSELAHFNAFQPQPREPLSRQGVQMSLVAQGRQYIRDGTGAEQLYDLRRDPGEAVNLAETAEGRPVMGAFRRMLLDVLEADPGSIEVENAYLKPYRRWLQSLAPAGSPSHDRAGSADCTASDPRVRIADRGRDLQPSRQTALGNAP
jgi:arylsulfatase A-like enzyme